MDWIEEAVSELSDGKEISLVFRSSSMKGLIRNGSTIKLVPVGLKEIEVGDIVLAKVKRKYYINIVSSVTSKKANLCDSNDIETGWVKKRDINGIVVQ